MRLPYKYLNLDSTLSLKVLAVMTIFFSSFLSADAAVNVNKLIETCTACHGKTGHGIDDSYPNLSGQKVGYMINQITAFRDGTRKNALMDAIVSKLSDQQIEAVATYYAAQPPLKEATNDLKENMQGKHVRAYCLSCHGMEGVTVNDIWPNLAGQNKTYLINQLQAFKSGQRQSPIMAVIANELNDQQIQDVAEYFSQQSMPKLSKH